jgi:hypothetical protein
MPRKFAYVALATLLVVVGAGLTRWSTAPRGSVSPAASPAPTPLEAPEAGAGIPLRRPPAAVAELGVLTRRTEIHLDPGSLAERVTPAACGETPACDAVRATLADGHATTLRIVATNEWEGARFVPDAGKGRGARDAGASRLPSLREWPTALVVHVAVAPSKRQLALRAAFAAAVTLAADFDGWVVDPVLGRTEDARTFAGHAVTEPLDAPVFRADRIRVVEEPAGDDVVRLRTAGLARWGAPEVEALAVPIAARAALTDVVLGVAAAVANGADASPVAVSRANIEEAAGRPAADAGSLDGSAVASLPIALVSVADAPPDVPGASDFVARIEPERGEGPLAYLELGERFFGTVLAATNEDAQAPSGTAERLAAALDRAGAPDATSGKVFVRMPFEIPGGGHESLWVEVTRHDARTLTGRIADDPLAATDVARGDEVTRPRSDVLDVRLR